MELPESHVLDIGDDIRPFLKVFKIKKIFPVHVNLSQREDIESFLTHSIYEEGDSICDDYYTLNYCSDMWYGCELCHLNKDYLPEPLFRGEGDTTTFALLALLILLKENNVLDDSGVSYIKSLF